MLKSHSLGWLPHRRKWQQVNLSSELPVEFSTMLYIRLDSREKTYGLPILARVRLLKIRRFSICHLWSEKPIYSVWSANYSKLSLMSSYYWEMIHSKQLPGAHLSQNGVVLYFGEQGDSTASNAWQRFILHSLSEACINGYQSLLT